MTEHDQHVIVSIMYAEVCAGVTALLFPGLIPAYYVFTAGVVFAAALHLLEGENA